LNSSKVRSFTSNDQKRVIKPLTSFGHPQIPN
jgi:hypothetical protein